MEAGIKPIDSSAPPPAYPDIYPGVQKIHPDLTTDYPARGPEHHFTEPVVCSSGSPAYGDQESGYPQQSDYIPLQPGPALQQPGGTTQLVYHQQPVVTVVSPPGEKFIGQTVLALIAIICGLPPFGIVALLLTISAKMKARSERELAHTLGVASYILSGIGIGSLLLAIVVVVVVILL